MKYRTKKQALYFDEVIRLHQELGYGEDRISRILPIGHTTVPRWISMFAAENANTTSKMAKKKEIQPVGSMVASQDEVKALQQEIKQLRAQLEHEALRAEAFDELINVAEAQFNIPIRKKPGAKR